MTGERSRLVDISKGFRLLAGIDDKKYNELLNQPFPIMLLRDEFGLRKFIDPEKMEKVLKDAFARTYDEMNFMEGDPYLEAILEELEKHPAIYNHWKFLNSQPEGQRVRTMDNRIVYLRYNGIPVKMKYHAEILPSNPRFTMLDYSPTNYVIKLLQRFA